MTDHDIPEPGTQAWEDFIDREVRRKQFYAEVDSRLERDKYGERSSSWERIDLTDAIYGADDELKPRWMHRHDGENLLYPGCTHSFHGSTGSGKTWAALLAAAQVLNETDEHVLYLDYESFAVQIVRRMLTLGVAQDSIKERLHYLRPRHRPDVADIDKNAFGQIISRPYAVAVVDGANICMGLSGLNPNNAEEVAAWHELILNPIAERTGAATVANDHVPKKADLSGFAIGSQHKVAGLTGASFTVEQVEPFGRGLYGKATIRVGDKDREGYIRGIGFDDKQPDGLLVAELHIDAVAISTTLKVNAALFSPQDATIAQIADQRKRRNGSATGNGTGDGRPTKEMEVVSAYWKEKKDPQYLTERTKNKTVDMIRTRQTNQEKPPMSRDRLRMAIDILADENTKGGPYAVMMEQGRSQIYLNVKQYFEASDPVVIAAQRQAQQAQNVANDNIAPVISMKKLGSGGKD